LNQFKDCDITILLEIWGSDVDEIPAFDIIALSPPRKNDTKKSGRFSGGVLIAVKSFLSPYTVFSRLNAGGVYLKLGLVNPAFIRTRRLFGARRVFISAFFFSTRGLLN